MRDTFNILSLDGGGSKGVYTLGILREIEALAGSQLYQEFDLIYGTSTGAIIAALLGLGRPVDEISNIYLATVPEIMKQSSRAAKSQALFDHSTKILNGARFEDFRTNVGIVATNYELAKPMIFKSSPKQSFSMAATFQPGFGCSVADAVRASSAAFPFFEKVSLPTTNQGDVLLIDGGFIANNPTLLAIADAVHAFKIPREKIKVLSLGTGIFKEPKLTFKQWVLGQVSYVRFVMRMLEANSNTIEQLRALLFRDIDTVRISETFTQDEYAANLLTSDRVVLTKLMALGRNSFSKCELDLKKQFGWFNSHE